jgi:hypothetical protein
MNVSSKYKRHNNKMGTAAEALEKNLILAERRFVDITNGNKPYDGEKIEIFMQRLLDAYNALVEHEKTMIDKI